MTHCDVAEAPVCCCSDHNSANGKCMGCTHLVSDDPRDCVVVTRDTSTDKKDAATARAASRSR